MKVIQFLLNALTIIVILAAIAGGLAFVPAVQTWAVNRALAGHPEVSIGRVSAGLSHVELDGVSVERGGVVLTAPTVTADVPVLAALLHHHVALSTLVAKGWTLDSTALGPELNSPAQLVPGAALAAVQSLFRGYRVPLDLTVASADLEGDVVAHPSGEPEVKIHVAITGGGLGASRSAEFAVVTSSVITQPGVPFLAVDAHGRLTVGLDDRRSLTHLGFAADLIAQGGNLEAPVALAAKLDAMRTGPTPSLAISVDRGRKRLASVLAQATGSSLGGTWSADVSDADLAPFLPNGLPITFDASGEGRFDSDSGLRRIHLTGKFGVATGPLTGLVPALQPLGALTFSATFDATQHGRTLHVGQLTALVAGDEPVAIVRVLQPLDLNESTGACRAGEPDADLLAISVLGLPPSWVAAVDGGIAWSGPAAKGELLAKIREGHVQVRTQAPLTVSGATLRFGGLTVGRNVDLTLPVAADWAPDAWRIVGSPLTVAQNGRTVADASATAAYTNGSPQGVAIAGTWHADLGALADLWQCPALSWAGPTASGKFTVALAAGQADIEGAVLTSAGKPSLSAGCQTTRNADGSTSFTAPVKIDLGHGVSDFSAEGVWGSGESGPEISARVTGDSLQAADVAAIAAALTGAGAAEPAGEAAHPTAPAWGRWSGQVSVSFDTVRAFGWDLSQVGGMFNIGPAGIRLQDARAAFGHRREAFGEGTLAFAPSQQFPYRLSASARTDKLEAGPWFSRSGGDPLLEGQFSVSAELHGEGADLPDLARRTRKELKFTSDAGIVRLFQTDVADAIPQAPDTIGDKLSGVGSTVGSLFGMHGHAGGGKNPLSRNADEVLDFTTRITEIGYDRFDVDAIIQPDGSIDLPAIALVAADERVTGSGRIAPDPKTSFQYRPLSLRLEFWAHGRLAELARATGLASPQVDAKGYRRLAEPIRVTGSLAHPSLKSWNELLVKAALQPAKPGGK